jgi:hypothetical protein
MDIMIRDLEIKNISSEELQKLIDFGIIKNAKFVTTNNDEAYSKLFNNIFEFKDESVIVFSDFIKQIETNVDSESKALFNWNNDRIKTNNDPQWKVFKKFMKEQLNLEPKRKSVNGKTKYSIDGIKLKSTTDLNSITSPGVYAAKVTDTDLKTVQHFEKSV